MKKLLALFLILTIFTSVISSCYPQSPNQTSTVTVTAPPVSTSTPLSNVTPSTTRTSQTSPTSKLTPTPTSKLTSSQPSIVPGIDLDVTYISREPEYDWNAKKNCPSPGDSVTFTAHIVNKGLAPTDQFAFQWLVDNNVVLSGNADSIPSQTESTLNLDWQWQTGRHYISFQADPQNLIPETSKTNNSITDPTDALTLAFWVEQSVYDQFNARQNGAGTYSWEDFAQRNIEKMNLMFELSAYPLAPQGILTRVRLDKITIVPDGTLFNQGPWHAPMDNIYDGRWGFSVNEWQNASADRYDVEWGLIHELGHYLLGLVDVYALDVQGGDVKVIDESGNKIVGTPLLPFINWDVVHYASRIYDMMHDMGPYSFYSDYHAYAINRIWLQGQRPHNGWTYINDIPSECKIRVLDNNDQPMKNVEISIYQTTPGDGSSGAYSQLIDNTPDIVGTTDSQGLFSLGKTPFGNLKSNGILSGVDLVKLKDLNSNKYRYVWLEVTDFSIAYWSGETNLHIEDVHFPDGPLQLHLSTNAVTFSALQGVNPDPQNVEVAILGEGAAEWSITNFGASWLRTIPSSDPAALRAYPAGPLTLIIDSAGLSAGTYTTQLNLNSVSGNFAYYKGESNVSGSPQKITVTLTVTQP